MNDQNNKQQQPQQGNKQDNNQQGQHSTSNPQNSQSQSKSDTQSKADRQDDDDDSVKGGMNQPGKPDKKTQIDDNPDETQKKIPNMQNKH